jgi:hypothetical protein
MTSVPATAAHEDSLDLGGARRDAGSALLAHLQAAI